MFRGTKTSVNIDNVEERKVHDHFNSVTSRLEKLHKSLMWNMFIGRSFLDKVQLVTITRLESTWSSEKGLDLKREFYF